MLNARREWDRTSARGQARNAAAVVIVLTNYPLPQYRDRCLEAGADFFFDKSVQFEDVSPSSPSCSAPGPSRGAMPSAVSRDVAPSGLAKQRLSRKPSAVIGTG
ncbi:MAG: hypothetical protein M0C28_31790 [Candidatus Moduliflexus flocculans]|nr:hypothetical protein [Candidatus Moduliflexus flocculans]